MLKVLRRIGLAALALCSLYLAAAFVLGLITVNRDFTDTRGGVPIGVCSNGVHADFVLPLRSEGVDWSEFFPPEQFSADVMGFDHIGIGWGDLDFYRSTPRWSDFETSVALRALLGRGPAALHVQYRSGPGANEDCRRLEINAVQYRALADYVVATTDSRIPAARGYGATDLFYRARGRFSAFKSCNVWVGEGLKASGLPSGLWTLFAFQVLSHL